MKIVIGAETEYGIFMDGSDRGSPYENSLQAAYAMVEAAVAIGPQLFRRPIEGIGSLEEHELIEALGLKPTDKETDVQKEKHRAAFSQRRGLTGHVLVNGARYYLDMGHPEYSIPETIDPHTAMVAQKAGDHLLALCRTYTEGRLQARIPGGKLKIWKNNSDGKGSSYACHENYALSPSLFDRIIHMRFVKKWDKTKKQTIAYREPELGELSHVFINFLVSRQIVTGAGKVGSEKGRIVPYQITQRADFIETDLGSSTTFMRPIINTRDIPYADHALCRRLHVIVGDSNMSELSLLLKFGTTSLFLMMLEDGFLERHGGTALVPLVNPVRSYRNVSRDLTLRHRLAFKNGTKSTALKLQREYFALAKRFAAEKNLSFVWHDVTEKWERVLTELKEGKTQNSLAANLDWVIKKRLLDWYMKKTGADPLSGSCKDIALQYHDIDPTKSIYTRLTEDGHIIRLTSEDKIQEALLNAPPETRAWLRGEMLKRYPHEISSIAWDHVGIEDVGSIHMGSPYHGSREELKSVFADFPSSKLALKRMQKLERKNLLPGYTIWLTPDENKKRGGKNLA